MSNLGSLKVYLNAESKGFQKGMRAAENSLRRFSKRVRTASIAGGAVFAGLAAKSAQLAARFEQTRVSFETMIGSADEAGKVISDLRKFSTVTPFTPNEIFKSAKMLMAFGIEGNKTKDVLKSIGDVSAGTGKDISDLSRIYGKVFTKGKIQAEELNQLSEAGIPIIQTLSSLYKKTGEEIFKMGSRGELKFDDMRKAFEKMSGSGGKFFNMMEKQSKTVLGQWSTLKGQFEDLAITLGTRLLPILNKMVDAMNKIFPEKYKPIQEPSGKLTKQESNKRDKAFAMRFYGLGDKEADAWLKLPTAQRYPQIYDKFGGLLSNKEMTAQTRIGKATGWADMKETIKRIMGGKEPLIGAVSRTSSMDDFQSKIIEDPYQKLLRMAEDAMESQQQVIRTAMTPVSLAEVVQAGSRQSFALRTGGRVNRAEKIQKQNLVANKSASEYLRDMSLFGVSLKDVCVLGGV